MDKRPYQIKLSKKASLIDGTKGNASKKWVLLANYADPTLLRNSIVLNTAYELGISSTPQCRTIDLYYDGEYCGTYLLAEKDASISVKPRTSLPVEPIPKFCPWHVPSTPMATNSSMSLD